MGQKLARSAWGLWRSCWSLVCQWQNLLSSFAGQVFVNQYSPVECLLVLASAIFFPLFLDSWKPLIFTCLVEVELYQDFCSVPQEAGDLATHPSFPFLAKGPLIGWEFPSLQWIMPAWGMEWCSQREIFLLFLYNFSVICYIVLLKLVKWILCLP